MKSFTLHLLAAGCIAASLSSPAWAAADLSFGQTAIGTISTAAQVDSYTFSASANDAVIFTSAATSGTLSPLIQLYDPNSTLIGTVPGSCTGASAAEMGPVMLAAAGTYTVTVGDCGGANTGGYNLYAQRTNNPSGAANLSFSSTPASLINLAAQSDSFTFSANANDVVDLTMTAASGTLNPKIRLYNPDGSLNSSNHAGSGSTCSGAVVEMNAVSLPTTGIYTVILGDCGDTKTGNYAVSAQRTNNPAGATPVFWSQTQSAYIGSAAQRVTYAFAGTASNVVDLTVTEKSGSLRPKIRLYSPDGSLLSSTPSGSCGGGTSAALNSVTLAQDGTYTLLVSDCLDTSTGEYDLTSSCSGACPVTPLITWAAPAAITYGTALSAAQLDATASVPGTTITGNMVYSPALGAVPNGGLRTLTATFTPDDMTDYTIATAAVQLTVNRVTPTVTWATPAAIPYGTLLSATQLDATASEPGSFFYSPGMGALLGGGLQTLSAIFNPSDAVDYTTATGSVQLTVDQAAGIISPARGSTLAGSNQSFSWSPGAGVTAYIFHLGTLGVGSDDLYAQGSTTATSVNVTGIPEDGVTLYVRLYSKINGVLQYVDYTYTEAGTPTPPALTSPTPTSTLAGSSVTFTWTPGSGVTEYVFHLGNQGVGSGNLYNSGATTATSASVTGLPVNGVTLYARLYAKISGVLQYIDYTYTEAGTPAPAALTSPTPGGRLSGSSVTFHWSPGSGATEYVFHLGSNGVGSDNLYNSNATRATSANVTVPANGATVYARLYSEINGSLQYADYTYTAAGTPAPAALTSPTPPGSRLAGASVNFSWSSGTGVTAYMLWVGTTGIGAKDLYAGSSTTATSASVTVPANGAKVYARLFSQISGVWSYTDTNYIAAGTPTTSALTFPTPPGSTLSGSSVTFQWSPGTGVTAYMLWVGTTGMGAKDLYAGSSTTATSAGVTVPTNGAKVYARLFSEISGVWSYVDTTYIEAGAPAPAAITFPTPPGSTLSGSSVIFQWSPGTGVTAYMLWVGSKGIGSKDLYAGSSTTANSQGVTVPTDGVTIYVRLFSKISGVWSYTDTAYTEAGTPAPAALTFPAPPGSKLSGSSVNFTWSSGTGVTAYMLWVGTTGMGAKDLYAGSSITGTSAGVTVPAGGGTVFVRLFSEISGAWQYTDSTFIESGTAQEAMLTTPTPSTTLSSSSVTFYWSPGSGVTAYMLWVGSTGIASKNLYNGSPTTATSAGSITVPANGAKVYVRLLSQINGVWQSADYTYTAE